MGIISFILAFQLLIFFKNVTGQDEVVTAPPNVAESQAVDLEDDKVGSDLDGMKALFSATLSG